MKDKSANKNKKSTGSEAQLPAIAPAPEEDPVMNQAQCITWRGTEVRSRIRLAVARWAGLSAGDISSTQQLKQIAPTDDGQWGPAQQTNLIAITNNLDPPIFRSIIPDDDDSQMEAPNELIPGETTVLEWEDIVWRNQSPRTFCRREFGI